MNVVCEFLFMNLNDSRTTEMTNFEASVNKSTVVNKIVDPFMDPGNLLLMDRDPIEGDLKLVLTIFCLNFCCSEKIYWNGQETTHSFCLIKSGSLTRNKSILPFLPSFPILH